MPKPIYIPYDIFLKDLKEICLKKINNNIKHDGSCWTWTGLVAPDIKTRLNIKVGITISAQRASWLCFKGDLSDDLQIQRRCDNKLCINPDHLYLAPLGATYEELMDIAEVYDEDMNLIKLPHAIKVK